MTFFNLKVFEFVDWGHDKLKKTVWTRAYK